MAAVSRGAAQVGGVVVGLLPGTDRSAGEPARHRRDPDRARRAAQRAAGAVAATSSSWRPSSRGAADVGGVVLGLLPGTDRADANPYVSVAVPTGLGELRNGLLVRSSDVVVSVGGSWGTLSEVALAVRTGVPVVAIAGWTLTAADGRGSGRRTARGDVGRGGARAAGRVASSLT